MPDTVDGAAALAKTAFALAAETDRRLRFFAETADAEGFNDVAAVLRQIAESERDRANDLLRLLETDGDPATGLPFADTPSSLVAAIAGKRRSANEVMPTLAAAARAGGRPDLGDLFDRWAAADKAHAGRFEKARETLV